MNSRKNMTKRAASIEVVQPVQIHVYKKLGWAKKKAKELSFGSDMMVNACFSRNGLVFVVEPFVEFASCWNMGIFRKGLGYEQ